VLAVIAVGILAPLNFSQASKAAVPQPHPMIRGPNPLSQIYGQNQEESTNWAGYAITGPDGSATAVSDTWDVPSTSCGSQTTYAAFWVGIDGFNSNTVEQTGVLAE